MKLNQLLDIELLNKHRAAGFVGVQSHPTLPLRIYNYTHLAQYDGKAWGDGTIDYCRGLIVDNEDNIVARPFKKFHNLNTASIPETCEENLPKDQPLILKKYDGSLGIYWQYGEHFGIATRGSFTSPQAYWATEWLLTRKDGYPLCAPYHRLGELTPLFEIVYPENRIVVKYDFEGLVLLGLVHKETGMEICYQGVMEIGSHNNIRVAESLTGADLKILQHTNIPNEEGYVVSYPRLNQDDLKVKIKMADYVRLHRIVTGMSARTLWELCKCGTLGIGDLPESIRDWAEARSDKLYADFFNLQKDTYAIYNNRPVYDTILPAREYRKKVAEYFFQQNRPELKSLFFLLLDGKIPELREAVWDMIEPRGDDRSFQPLDIEEASA